MDNMIEVKDITMRFKLMDNRINSLKEFVVNSFKGQVHYSTFDALKNVSFCVERGDVVGLIGRNGAGKSTVLKVISGILKPTSGCIDIRGNVVPLLELGSGFDFDMTGRENIFLNGAILGYSKEFLKRKYNDIIEFSELGQFIDIPMRNYSSGMIARLAFSIATLVEPEILIVDEVLSVGDMAFQEKSQNRMMELMNGGATVLYVSHSLVQIRQICKHVVWLDHGEVVMCGDTQTVCDQYEASFQ